MERDYWLRLAKIIIPQNNKIIVEVMGRVGHMKKPLNRNTE